MTEDAQEIFFRRPHESKHILNKYSFLQKIFLNFPHPP